MTNTHDRLAHKRILGAEIARNSVFILLAKGINIFSSFFILIAVVRYLPVAQYGEYSFIIAYVSSVMALAYFGIQQVAVREIARDRANAARHIGIALQLRTVLSVVAAVLLLVSMRFMKLSSLAVAGMTIAVVSEFFLSLSMLSRAVFQAFEKMIYDPMVSIIYCILLSAGMIVAIVLDWGLLGLLGAAAVANVAQFLVSAGIFSSRFVRPSFDFDRSVFRTYLKDAAVIGVGIFFYQNLFRINVLMLKWLGKIEDVAYFQIAHNFIMQLQVLPFAFVTAVFPVLSRLLNDDPAGMRDAYQRIFRYMLILSFFVSLFIFGFSREIIETVFGSKYSRSAAALMIVSWAVAPLSLDMLMNSMLIAMNKQRYAVIYAGVTLFLNLLFAVLLIPSHGFIAASWLALSSYVLLLMFSLYFVSRNGFAGVGHHVILKTLLAGLTSMAAIHFLKSVSVAFAFIAASGLYFGALYRMRAFGTDELALLKGLYSKITGRGGFLT